MNKSTVGELIIDDESCQYGLGLPAEEYTPNKVRYLRISDLDDSGNLLDDDKKSISAPNIQEYILKPNDLVVARTGTSTGRTYVYSEDDEKLAYAGFLIKYVFDSEKINPRYMKYFTISNIYKKQISGFSGSTRGNMNAQNFKDITVIYPDRKIQDKMVKLFDLISKKIKNNNKIISELESMTKTIYNYWFLQFEFPNENGKPYRSSGEKMVWNDELKREIPEGWEIKQLGCFANLYQPKTISEKDLNSNGKYFVYGANGIIGKYDKFNHQDREIAICCRGASCGNYVMTIPNSWITGNSMIVSTKNKEFIYYSLSKSTIDNYITGSAQPQITRTNLESAKFLIPSSKILNEFERKATTVRSKIETIFYENQELASLRDFLLPLLMNGQVTFKEES